MLLNLAAFLAALILSLVFTWVVRSVAPRLGLVDRPDGERKTHEHPIPRAGGVAIYVSLAAVVGTVLVLIPIEQLGQERIRQLMATLTGASVIFLLGLADDLFNLRPRIKFGVQVVVALGMVMAGLTISGVHLPGGYYDLPDWFSVLLTVAWIVGITNAFNLIDGADGLAAGAAVFAALSLGAVLFLAGNGLAVLASLALTGATLGFLFFNFPPASIFLGDCGSLLLGFTIAAIGLMSAQAAPTLVAVAIPVVSVGLPLLDTLLALTRRFLRHEPIFRADRGHIHHRLVDFGHSPRQVALVLYAVCAAFSVIALLLLNPDARVAGGLLAVMGVITWLALQRLHIPELLEIRRIVGRGMRQRSAIARNVRIREATVRLAKATDVQDIFAALRHAFEGGDFVRIELALAAPLGEILIAAGEGRWDGEHARWHWSAERVAHSTWEMRIPFRDAAAKVVGNLCLWHSSSAPHTLTDMRLIANELHPALWGALQEAVRLTAVKEVLRVPRHASSGRSMEGPEVTAQAPSPDAA